MPENAPQFNDILLYSAPTGEIKIEVIFEGETFWLSQRKMAQLFGVEVPTVNYHLKEIFKSDELDEDSVIRNFRITAADGKNYDTQFYNLDAIIAVGYRVNSYQATQFRIWATTTLKEFIVKGFVLDDERLKQGRRFGKDYFDELLERIREIRASEWHESEQGLRGFLLVSLNILTRSQTHTRYLDRARRKPTSKERRVVFQLTEEPS